MAAIIPPGTVAWGLQLPIQSQSTVYAQPWEAGATSADLGHLARTADRAGAFYVAVCDHVGVPRPADEKMSDVWYDTMTTLGWLGAQTERVHLLSHVYVLPYRHPLMTAKAFATLDNLTDGRAILGVGAGHLESEFRFLGVDFESRGRAVEEAIPVIRAAFEDEYPTVGGPGAESGIGIAPRPVRPDGPPIWIGGSSKAAIRRAARFGDGWLPQGPPPMGTSAAIAFIREERAAAGLPEAFDIGVTGGAVYVGEPDFEVEQYTIKGSVDQILETLSKFTSRGINQIQLRFQGRSVTEVAEQLEAFGSDVAPQFTGTPT